MAERGGNRNDVTQLLPLVEACLLYAARSAGRAADRTA
jgi:hypothetical protein